VVSSRDFVYRKFADFYNDLSIVIPSLSSLAQRELGFLLFKERVMVRHKVFARQSDLRSFLGKTVPSDVYRSCAYYENPSVQMDKKGWLGADLVFDIDADHIPTACDKLHDEWTCSKCGFKGRCVPPELCPVCSGQKFDTKTWLCEGCLDFAKSETLKLIDILSADFGFSDDELKVFFSGHRGYHVHVESETVKTLDAIARKEIVDYVSGLGLSKLSGKVIEEGSSKRLDSRGFGLHDFGWNRRLKLGLKASF
jgi:DNA primase small subunit